MRQRMVVRRPISRRKNHRSSRRVARRAPTMRTRLITSPSLASKMHRVLMRVVIPRRRRFHRRATTRRRRFHNPTRRTLVNRLLPYRRPRLPVTINPPLAVRYNCLIRINSINNYFRDINGFYKN